MRRIGLLFKQRLAELKDRHPAVIAEVRGEGGTTATLADFDHLQDERVRKAGRVVDAGDRIRTT